MATLTVRPYGQFATKLANKEIDLDSDAITITLHTSSYTPNFDTHAYVSDLTNELATGGGYTAGGIALSSLSRTYVAAASWSLSAAVSTAYAVGDVRRPSTSNGYLYRAVVAGTSGASAPTWPTVVGTTVVDGGVTWLNVGSGATVFTAAAPSWASFTATGIRYAILSDRTAGTAATQPLIACGSFTTDQAGGGGAWSVNWDPAGILVGFVLA